MTHQSVRSPTIAVGAADTLVVLAASAGGIEALITLLGALPGKFPAAVMVVQHRTPARPHLLATILSRVSTLRIVPAVRGRVLRPGTVYVIPPDLHGRVTAHRTVSLTDGRRIRHLRSSANPLFESAAEVFESRAIGVVLTGGGTDATDGVQAIATRGGVVIAQDETTSRHFSMPRSAIETGVVRMVLPLDEIAPTLVRLAAARLNP